MDNNNLQVISEKKIKLKIFLVVYLYMFVALVFSEYINAFFNIKYDGLGYSAIDRIPFAFKHTVMALYLIFSTIIYIRVRSYLKPLFNYFKTGKGYKKARKAAVKIPWFIVKFQMIVWAVGTTAYYILKGWNPDSGIPYFFGLLSKVATGGISALYVVFTINIILQDTKQKLNMTSIYKGENDLFSRYKDLIANIGAVFYLIVNLTYIAYYFSLNTHEFSQGKFLFIFLPTGILLFIIGIIPTFLSKKEYNFQIKTLKDSMENLTGDLAGFSKEIPLINFDELGEMAVYMNGILHRFRTLFDKISTVVSTLSDASDTLHETSGQSSSSSSQQAAATAEIVATMEDSDKLSKSIGSLADEVSKKSEITAKYVDDGNSVIQNNLETNMAVKSANNTTIDFIEMLSTDIKSINDVVKMINGIADQIKIIAFNAELEASTAGDAGKSFEIVATEIRRLADRTVASTTEINERISIIEKGANKLVSASVDATKLIEQSYSSSKEAESIFIEIKKSSEDTVSSSNVISKNIGMQITGFEQILLTIKQIAIGVSDSADSTAVSAKVAVELKEQVENLRDYTDK